MTDKETGANKGLPPFVKSWPQFYLLVCAWLAACIGLMYWFTKHYS